MLVLTSQKTPRLSYMDQQIHKDATCNICQYESTQSKII
jgi:hypothetical protein